MPDIPNIMQSLAGKDTAMIQNDAIPMCPECSYRHGDKPHYCWHCGDPIDGEPDRVVERHVGDEMYCPKCPEEA